ncbi:MAG: hypothetical protein NZ604_05105 [Flavobacteriales bacterium]|nr:hypothetical protein [Flavobacteriales bacterium]
MIELTKQCKRLREYCGFPAQERVWVGDRSIEEVVRDCPRGDWLLLLAARLHVDHRSLALVRGHCAQMVKYRMTDDVFKQAVDVAIAYGEGLDTEESLHDVWKRCVLKDEVCEDTICANKAAMQAAHHPHFDKAIKPDVGWWVVYAILLAEENIYTVKESDLHKEVADIVRKYIGQKIIDKVNEGLKLY